jgi:hypothetical protein
MFRKQTTTLVEPRRVARDHSRHGAVKARVTIFVIVTSLAAALAPIAEAAGRWG